MSELRVAGVVNDSITDGSGLRFTIFLQGCEFRCDGCHNPQTWDKSGGKTVHTDQLIKQITANKLLKGVTFSGGEPFLQAHGLLPLAKQIKAAHLDLWVYSGYLYEELANSTDNNVRQLLNLADVLVDGRYEKDKRNLDLTFRGSENQRIIDVQQTINQQKIVTLDL